MPTASPPTRDPTALADLQERADRIRWFHRMEIAPGVWSPGIKDKGLHRTLRRIHMPADFGGRSVLDVGAWDGYYSFEAERRGAGRVLATDSYSWNGEGWGSKEGFLLAREALGSRVEDMDVDVMDLAPETVGTWDVVLFLGVLYHLKYPLEALERVASVTRDMLILETHVDTRAGDKAPFLAFYPGAECNNDPSNWCGPNPSCVEAMLKVAGFRRVHTFYHAAPYPEERRPRWQKWLLERGGGDFPGWFKSAEGLRRRIQMRRKGFGRIAVHAWKT